MNFPLRLGFSVATTNPTGFKSEVLRLYFPVLESWVAQSIQLPRCSPRFICSGMWDLPVHQLPPWGETDTQLSVSAPPTGLDEYFFFNSLVVGLLYSSIFWQLWLSFVFKFVVVLLVVRGGTVYLPMPPSWPEVSLCFSFNPENNSSTVILLPTTFYRWENLSAEWLRHRPQTQYTAVRLGPQAIWLQGPGSKDSITHLSAATVSYRVGYILYSASRINPGISGVGNWKQYHFLTFFEA